MDYEVIQVRYTSDPDPDTLSHWFNEGWTIISLYPSVDTTGTVAYFKRELQ